MVMEVIAAIEERSQGLFSRRSKKASIVMFHCRPTQVAGTDISKPAKFVAELHG